MERLKSLLVYLMSLPGVSTRWAFAVISGEHRDDMIAPGKLVAVWSVEETEASKRRGTAVPGAPLRLISRPTSSTRDRIQRVAESFALWFGLLFSAALIGTFIVLGLALSYALVMSLIGH